MPGEPKIAEIRKPIPTAEPLTQTKEAVFPQSEKDRLQKNLQGTIDLLWKQNRPLLDDDYAKPEEIIKDKGDFEKSSVDSKEVKDEADRRKKEQDLARTDDISQIPADMVDQVAQKLVSGDESLQKYMTGDESFTGKEATDLEVKETAARIVIAQRKELREAFEILRAPKRAREAAQKATEEKINEMKQANESKIQEKIALQLKSKNETREKGTPEITEDDIADDIEQIRSDEQKVIELQISDITTTIAAQYYDDEQKVYHKINEDGTPSSDTVSYHDSYPALVAQLQQIADQTQDNQPTEDALKAQQLLQNLAYNPKENRFAYKTEKELQQIETPKQLMARLEVMRTKAMDFLLLDEHINSKDKKIVSAAISAYKQLVLAHFPTNTPVAVRLLHTRSALKKYQEFRKKVIKVENQSPDNAYSDWDQVQIEADAYQEGVTETDAHIKKSFPENVEVDKRISQLILDGHLSEAIVAIFNASSHKTARDQRKALNTSEALKNSGLADYLSKEENRNQISYLMEAFFGNRDYQENLKKGLEKQYGELFSSLDQNKWLVALQAIIGLGSMAVLGRIDDYLSTGLEADEKGTR